MKTKLVIVALIAISAVSAVLAGLAIAKPAATQGDPPDPTLPARQHHPAPTLAPLTPDELDELVGSLCGNLWVDRLSVTFQDDVVRLDWSTPDYYGPHIGPRYDEYDVGYRIEHRRDDVDDPDVAWELVAEVADDTWWEGVPATGLWIYRVGVSSITKDGRTLGCHQILWGPERAILNPADLAGFAASVCPGLQVRDLTLEEQLIGADQGLQDVATFLAWHTRSPGFYIIPPYDEYAIVYRIDRRRDGTNGAGETWELVDQVTGEGRWPVPADPGQWIYSVSVGSVSVGGATAPCAGAPGEYVTYLKIPTAEEIALEAEKRRILHAETLRCAREAATANISEQARPIINEYIEEVVADQVADTVSISELAELTILICSTDHDAGYGAGSLPPLLLLILAGSGF